MGGRKEAHTRMGKYSFRGEVDESRTVKARGSDLRVSFKNTRETAMAIRGLSLRRAQRYLDDVIKKKQAVTFHRFCGGVGRAASCLICSATSSRTPRSRTLTLTSS